MSLELHEVLKRPIITEKAVAKKDEERTIVFEVDPRATKTLIKQAVEMFFKVDVEDVRTMNVKGKPKRRGFRSFGYRKNWKKAYVKLKPGQKIPEFVEI